MPDPEAREASIVSVDLSIPADPRFLETARALAWYVACYVGFAPADAERLSRALERLVAGLGALAPAGDPARNVQILFRTAESAMLIDVVYDSPGDAAAIGQRLNDTAAGGSVLGEVRRAVDRLELGARAGREYCRLICRRPGDP